MLHIFKTFAVGWSLCIYDYIKEFLELRKSLNAGIEQLFVHLNKLILPSNCRYYFTRQHIGKPHFIDFLKMLARPKTWLVLVSAILVQTISQERMFFCFMP